ncbi:MAG: histidine phosphatase family protein [Planctomycetota bacterium]
MKTSENNSPLKILLVEAGSTQLDDQGRITGSLDIPLSDQGQAEVEEAGGELSRFDIKKIYSAGCTAAKQTADLIASKVNAKIKVEDALLNLDFGLWHGKCIDELKENQPKLYRKWLDEPESVRPPEGETFEEVKSRVRQSVRKIRKKHKSGVIAIVAPAPLYDIIRSILEADSRPHSESLETQSLRWESLDVGLANA